MGRNTRIRFQAFALVSPLSNGQLLERTFSGRVAAERPKAGIIHAPPDIAKKSRSGCKRERRHSGREIDPNFAFDRQGLE